MCPSSYGPTLENAIKASVASKKGVALEEKERKDEVGE